LKTAGLTTVSFEIQAKAIARAVVASDSTETVMIVHLMNKKTGLYVVSSGVICFTSTIPWGAETKSGKKNKIVRVKYFLQILIINYSA
jgi:Tfp pilus assembly PilM family ATPase